MKIKILIILTIVSISSSSLAIAAIDSVGVETVDGRVFVLHKVEPKETLYSISKKYGVTTDQITSVNPGSEMGIGVGQVIKIPTGKIDDSTETTNENTDTESAGTLTTHHTVKPGETLYAISTLYPSSIEEIKKWNNLTSNGLDVGQKLVVSKPNSTTENKVNNITDDIEVNDKAEETVNETEDVEEESTTITNASKETTTLEKTEEIEETDPTTESTSIRNNDRPLDIDFQIKTKAQIDLENTEKLLQNGASNDSLPSKRTVDMGGYTKEFEKGYAVLMDNTEHDEHYLAFHKTLPIGTILQVTNLNNGKNVFVRVVGLLEHDDPKVILSVSKKAEIRLQSGNTTFLTEISYIP